MKRTIVAISFVLVAGLIGAAVAFVLLGNGPDGDFARPLVKQPIAVDTPPAHIVSQYRVAVRFPDRFEFDRESHNEVTYYDPQTRTRIVFVVTRPTSGAVFDEVVDAMERSFSYRGVVERAEKVSDTRAEFTLVEVFRVVSEAEIFIGEDCWGKPLFVRAVYVYDRTESPREAWLTQSDDDFPAFEFAYRCPT